MRTLLAVASSAALIAGLAITTAPLAHAAPPSYTIEVLPALPGDEYVRAASINDAGDVAGTSSDGVRTDLVVWRATTRQSPQVVVKGAAEVAGISGNGVVAGNTTAETTWWRPFIWRNGSLSVLQNGASQDNRFIDVSETGTVLDMAGSIWSSIESRTVLPHTLAGTTLTGVQTNGISGSGNFVVGSNHSGAGQTPLRWAGKTLQALGKPSGSVASEGGSVNDRGVAVGTATMKNGSDRSVIWDASGKPSWLPTAPGLDVQGPTAINNSGLIVGAGRASAETMAGYDRGVLWAEGKVHDLNDLITLPKGVTVKAAFDVNNAGQITGLVNVADGSYYGVTRGFVATPKAFDVYTTPGTHHYNGRDWKTTCEPYSRTTRCRTEIQATTIQVINGRYVHAKGWAFNNLTYLPSARTLWKSNPLAQPGNHTINGRQWKTECDNAHTGRNGCRSYMLVSVITATATTGGGYTYAVRDAWVFNNIVRFS
ncbi:hypothetical protein [Tessaracoccus antarcticus]|uniref:Uncharacterized protein n=1 Tax=Tessaracoccus antarcticus TaxID=2479848 RepID=A0A3M0GAL5_9ACTN|nr:hypothetical protein [Tessaracoccus antarcticus]RMB62011.1 hypothetical protein EAX62_05340 [Tessaracoccus antarcticus]